MKQIFAGEEFEKLADLLEQGQFELLKPPSGENAKKPSDIRLVYMMNDTAESFFVFHNQRWTVYRFLITSVSSVC